MRELSPYRSPKLGGSRRVRGEPLGEVAFGSQIPN